MNKPLPTPPREYDGNSLAAGLDALSLAGQRKLAAEKAGIFVRLSSPFKSSGKSRKTDKKLPDLPTPDSPSDVFIGGFDPRLLGLKSRKQPSTRTPMPIPHPLTVIEQQSLTMHYALQSMEPDTPTKSAPTLPRPHPHVNPPATPASAPNKPAPSVTPTRQRSMSVPPPVTTSPENHKVQCSATTKASRRCARRVRLPATHCHLDPIPDLYCHQHKKAMFTAAQTGFYIPKAGAPEKFVEFDRYISKYLQTDTQLALRVEMEKAISVADVPGYIYTFEIRDPKRPEMIQLKVGRSVKPINRLDQWDKQCGSKEIITRGLWPDTGGSLLKGNMQAGDPGPFCHRIERLVHIELADLSLHAPYENPDWPDNMRDPPPSSGPSRRMHTSTCADCGTVHREIFAFARPETGKYKGREWESIVKPVIEKWGEFVKEHYA